MEQITRKRKQISRTFCELLWLATKVLLAWYLPAMFISNMELAETVKLIAILIVLFLGRMESKLEVLEW